MHSNRFFRWAAVLMLLAMLLPVPTRAAALLDSLAVERQVYTYLTGKMELNSAAACGVLANIEYESGFQPTALGDEGTSFGLCQWHAGRYRALRSFCRSRSLDYRTVEGQMEYLNYELGSSYSALLTALRSVENSRDGAYRAGYLWCTQFERPADPERKAVTRGNAARCQYWNRYNSVIQLQAEEEPEQLSAEQVIFHLQQETVEIPLPPEDPGRHTPRHYTVEPAEMKPYVPHHLPPAAQEASFPYLGFAAAVVLLGAGGSWAILRLPNPVRRKKEIPAA